MFDEGYLLRGLDALCRAHETDYFGDGHRGAAIIAAYFLCREVDMEDGVSDVIAGMIDREWTHTDLSKPFPRESPDPGLVARVIEVLARSMDCLRQAGHNVILPALGLKAFSHLPDAVTPLRVEGICRLIGSFVTVEDIGLEDGDHIPGLGDPRTSAELILSELLPTVEAFEGRGQGWSGHLLTYGRALLDLRQIGHDVLADRGEHAFRLYIKRIRMGPLETDKPRPEHSPSGLLPYQHSYWELRNTRPMGIGHVFKYPYGFCGLMDLAGDCGLKSRCRDAAYRVL